MRSSVSRSFLLLSLLLSYALLARAAEIQLMPKQQQIFKSVLAVDATLTKDQYDRFWADFPKLTPHERKQLYQKLEPVMLMDLGIYFTSGSAIAKESSDREAQCAAKWDSLRSRYGRDYQVLMKEWTKLESLCRWTGVYEFRLSALYERLGDRQKAKKVIEDGLKHGTDNDNMLKLGKYSNEFTDLVIARDRDLSKYQRLEANYKSIATDEPQWSAAYEALANLQLYMGKRDDAIENAKKAIRLNAASWGGCRTLVVAYTGARRYSESRPLIRKCVELNDELSGEVDFMLASATTYVNLQEPKTAKAVLEALAERDPKAQDDPRFGALVKFIDGKLRSGGK
jgi:tetratricopeptide (TPR) repeat protein